MKLTDLIGNPRHLTPEPAIVSPRSHNVDSGLLFDPPALFSKSSDSEKKTVRVKRRRRTESQTGERERAEAPRRKRTKQSKKSAPPSGTGGSARPMGQIPGGRSPLLLIGIVVLLVICILPLMLIFGSGDSDDAPAEDPLTVNTVESEVVQEAPTTASEPLVLPPPSSDGQTWLVMLYQDADDKILEQDIYLDLNEAERVGSSDRVHIVAQVDRFDAGYRGDGNWSETKRFYITQDGDLQRVGSQQLEDLGEVNMADGAALVDFVTWAVEEFPADKHVLIMSDHGMGWPGGWSDPDPGGRDDSNSPLASALGDHLFLMELDEALGEIRYQTGLEQLELVGMDACLMGHVEVFSALAPHARYAVASQETEPAMGWAYTSFLADLVNNPDMSGADLSRLIVDSFIRDDQRIVDDDERASLLQKGSPLGGLASLFGSVSAEQLAQQMSQNITLTAVDLATMPALVADLNVLSVALQDTRQKDVAEARSYAQSFTSVFGSDIPASYIDLGNFAQLLQKESDSQAVAQAADRVLDSLDQAVIAEKHGPKKPGANGISIYFPNSQLYENPITGPESYTAVARRFADASLWDDFLAFHYAGQSFEAGAGELAVPERGAPYRAPGSGEISVSPVTLSDDTAAPGRPVLLSTDISGDNVGYVYLFVGFLDQEANSIYVADGDYLESDETREVDGVYYPDWGDGSEFTMEFEWEPIVFAIDDGQDSVVALFTPQTYGATFEDAIYTVDGMYTYADDGASRYARLYFSDGLLQHVFGFNGENGTGAPREIIPQSGDTFTILEKWMDLDNRGNVVDVSRQEGGTLTFGDQMFTWKELDAAPGQYIVGFIVEDLDGNTYQTYEQITVE